jgi:fluoride exporter
VTRPRPTPALVAAVGVGGAVGALARWGLGELAPTGAGFPWTTFAINVAGSLLLGLLPAVPLVRRHATLPLVLGTGVLGGFTTLSAYAEETRVLVADGATATAAAYVVGTLAACLLAAVTASAVTTAAERRAFADAEGDE